MRPLLTRRARREAERMGIYYPMNRHLLSAWLHRRIVLPVCWWTRLGLARALGDEAWAYRVRAERSIPWWAWPGVYIASDDSECPAMWKPKTKWWRYRNLHPTLEPK